MHYRWRDAKSINFVLKFYLYLTLRKSDFSGLTMQVLACCGASVWRDVALYLGSGNSYVGHIKRSPGPHLAGGLQVPHRWSKPCGYQLNFVAETQSEIVFVHFFLLSVGWTWFVRGAGRLRNFATQSRVFTGLPLTFYGLNYWFHMKKNCFPCLYIVVSSTLEQSWISVGQGPLIVFALHLQVQDKNNLKLWK